MDRLEKNLLPHPLRALFELLRPRPAMLEIIKGEGEWGFRFWADERPRFYIVLAGECWIEIRNEFPERLYQGDVLLFTRTPPLALRDRTVDFEMLGGILEVQWTKAVLLGNLLPPRMDGCEADVGHSRLARIMNSIGDECVREATTRQQRLARLVKVLLLEALRAGASTRIATTGLLAGFASRFLQVVGIPPMEYLARWRMSIAVDSLLDSPSSLSSIASKAGYR